MSCANVLSDPLPQVLTTRLFPKNQGALRYEITGIAARCDWVVLSDTQPPFTALIRQRETSNPRHVFLSLRSPFAALAFFFDHALPMIASPFVLISGSEDVTIPHQCDKRWRPFNDEERRRIFALLDDSRLLHWHAENLDAAIHPRLSPLPLGLVFPENRHHQIFQNLTIPRLADRPMQVLCAHRVREGPQWELRRNITRLCRESFADFCTILEDEVPESTFLELLQHHAFVICAEGGGLDPSPKAWQAILNGTIPIVRSTALDGAYRQLPVAFVNQWDTTALSAQKLAIWHHRYCAMHDDPRHRQLVLQRLGIDYWWERINCN